MVVVCVVCVVSAVVFVFKLFGGNARPSTWFEVLAEGVVAEVEAAGGGEGTEWAIGVDEHAGTGTTEGFEAKLIFCAVTPLPPTPPESAGNNGPSRDGASFASTWLFSGRGHLPRLVINSGEEDTASDARAEANSEGAQADSKANT